MSQRNVDDDNEFDRIYRMLSRCQTELQRQKPVVEAAQEWNRWRDPSRVLGTRLEKLAEALAALEKKS